MVGRSTCSDRALRTNKRMNASRNRPAGSLRSVTFTAGRVIRDVLHPQRSLCSSHRTGRFFRRLVAWSQTPWKWCHASGRCCRKHAPSAILVRQDPGEPTSVKGTCFHQLPWKHGTTEARVGREHATGPGCSWNTTKPYGVPGAIASKGGNTGYLNADLSDPSLEESHC